MARIGGSATDQRHDPAFDAFVADCSTPLLRSAQLLTGDRGHAEDLLQQTLMRTARRWRVARTAPAAYARRVLINLSRDAHRRALVRVREEPLDDVRADSRGIRRDGGSFTGASDSFERVAGRDAVITALAQLPQRQREVLVLRFYGDLTVAETADAMGASAGTVKS